MPRRRSGHVEGGLEHLPTVRVEPAGLEFDVGASETMMQAALRHGYQWPTVCGGEGQCRACFVVVLDGRDRLCPVGGLEAEGIRILVASGEDPDTVRLACQARVRGAVTVRKHGVRMRRTTQAAASDRQHRGERET